MDTKTLFNFLKRILLYQYLIYFSMSKFDTNLINSQKDFINKLQQLLLDIKLNNLSNINIPENDDIIFRTFLIFINTVSFFSILNFSFMQFISGFISIFIAFVYFNPFLKYNELMEQNVILNLVNLYSYLPSREFLIFVAGGLAMIAQSLQKFSLFYYIFCCCCCCDENKEKRKTKKCKINLQVEFDVNGSNNTSFE